MSHVERFIRATIRFSVGLILTAAVTGCADDRSSTVATPIVPTPIFTPTPTPGVQVATRGGSISGVVTEMTSSGSKPVAGAVLQHMSCGLTNCAGEVISREVTTDKDGAFRIPDLFNGPLNFLWITRDGYKPAEPNEPFGSCDGCNRIVSVNGDTRLDIEVIRQ